MSTRLVRAAVILVYCALPIAAQTIGIGQVAVWDQTLPPGTLDVGDGFGTSVASMGDLDGDGSTDFAIGAPGDDDGATDRGAVYLYFMGAFPSIAKLSSVSSGFGGAIQTGFFGQSVANGGDFDGNGVPELVVGSASERKVWVVALNKNALANRTVSVDGFRAITSAHACLQSPGPSCGVPPSTNGWALAVAGIGDLDLDGVPDLAIGDEEANDGCTTSPPPPPMSQDPQCMISPPGPTGAVWILFMNSDASVKSCQKISLVCGGFPGPFNGCPRFGSAVDGMLDRNGDGRVDLVVGAAGDDDGGAPSCGGSLGDNGALWVLDMNSNGSVQAARKVSNTLATGGIPNMALDTFGRSACAVGDLDGDGAVDFLVGAPTRKHCNSMATSSPGAAWMIFMNADGTVKAFQEVNAGCEVTQTDVDECSKGFGRSVVVAGDEAGGDRYMLVIGAPQFDASGSEPNCSSGKGVVFMFSVVAPFSGSWSAYVAPLSCPTPNTNPSVLTSTPFVLGEKAITTVVAALPQHTTCTLVVRDGHLCPPVATQYGQLWIAGNLVYSAQQPFVNGVATFQNAIPPDPALIDLTTHVTYGMQATSFGGGGGIKLTNALELEIGFAYP